MRRATVFTVTAPPGSGKTYCRGARFVVDEFLPKETGTHWSNFPLAIDVIAQHVAGRTGQDADAIAARLRVIPKEVETLWRKDFREGGSGPWEFFADADLTGAHIAVDEAHTVCGEHHSKDHRQKWGNWLSELRHRGATCELLSQNRSKIAGEIHDVAETDVVLTNSELRREPVLRALLADWYELRAGLLTREYAPTIWQVESRKVNGRWVEEHRVKWVRESAYYRFYSSYAVPKEGGKAAAAPPLQEYEKRSRLGLVVWFVGRNAGMIAWRATQASAISWCCWFGGAQALTGHFLRTMNESVAGKTVGRRPAHVAVAGKPASGPSASGTSPASMQKPQSDPEREALRKRVAELEELGEWAAEQLRADSAIGVLTEKQAVFRDGRAFAVGETIHGGIQDGRTVQSIDRRGRRVVLDDGSALLLVPAPGERLRRNGVGPQAGGSGLADRLRELKGGDAGSAAVEVFGGSPRVGDGG